MAPWQEKSSRYGESGENRPSGLKSENSQKVALSVRFCHMWQKRTVRHPKVPHQREVSSDADKVVKMTKKTDLRKKGGRSALSALRSADLKTFQSLCQIDAEGQAIPFVHVVFEIEHQQRKKKRKLISLLSNTFEPQSSYQ